MLIENQKSVYLRGVPVSYTPELLCLILFTLRVITAVARVMLPPGMHANWEGGDFHLNAGLCETEG